MYYEFVLVGAFLLAALSITETVNQSVKSKMCPVKGLPVTV